jgi:hypothetical protein
MNAHHGLARWIDAHAGVKDVECEMSAWVREMLSESESVYMYVCT